MSYYKNLREYLKALEENGKLVRINFPLNKDTEIHPLVRLQYRGLSEPDRKAFFFEKITDARGRTYSIPYVVGCMAGNRDIYALGMQCKPDQISETWTRALLNPIEPVLVPSGPVQEEVHMGDSLLEHGGLDEFPIPISTPGFDSAPYLTAPYWISKDPNTGAPNMGTYRAQIKAPDRTGVFPCTTLQGMDIHWNAAKKKGQPLQAAIVLGASPNIAYVSVTRIPHGINEIAVAGGIAGEPVELVKCKTVDLEVPAHAEIVIEGYLPTDEVEPEAPFGEATGYMGQREMMPYLKITAITHRKNPILQGFFSQMPPSESSKIRGIGGENALYKHLRYDYELTAVKAAAILECCGSNQYVVIQVAKDDRTPVEKYVEAIEPQKGRLSGKFVVIVNEDINPWDTENVNWALGLRWQPHRDTRMIHYEAVGTMDYSLEESGCAITRDPTYQRMPQASVMIVDARTKWPYPPVSLPRKEYMEHALEVWEKAGLPKLQLKDPWYGYDLGFWTDEDEEDAQRAVRGEYFQTGEKNASKRKKAER